MTSALARRPRSERPSRGEASSRRRRITSLLGPHRGSVVLLSTCSLGGGLVEALFLISVTQAAFAVTEGRGATIDVGGWEVAGAALMAMAVAAVALRVALAIAGAWLSAHLSSGVVASLRETMAKAYLEAQWSVQHGERGGRLQELLTTFANQGVALIAAVNQAVVAGCTLAALLLIAVLVDPLSSLAVIGAIAALSAILRPLRSSVRRQAKHTTATGMHFATAMSEMSDIGMEMHIFDVQPAMRDRVTKLIRGHESATRRMNFLRGVVPAVYSGLGYLALVGALAVGTAVEAASFQTVGAVMLVMLRSLTYGQVLQTGVASINASMPFLNEMDEQLERYEGARRVDGRSPVKSVDVLDLNSLSFEYLPGAPVLRSVAATIGPRQVVGIVGPSGAGKSTLVELLLGLRHPTTGSVLADGREIRTLHRGDWARRVTFVPQDAHLISGTVSDNIRFFRSGVGHSEIETASKMANLHEDVLDFPGGYERHVGERGSHLSGGQRQRLIIARALVERPDVLILDEPTSALDVRSEALIRDTLNNLRERMTVIIIAHRLSTLEICDRIMVIQGGELTAFDSPHNLENTNEFFRDSLRLSGMR